MGRRVKSLEAAQPADDHGRPFLFFPQRQTYEEALAYAGLVDHDGPVFPIRVVGVKVGDAKAFRPRTGQLCDPTNLIATHEMLR